MKKSTISNNEICSQFPLPIQTNKGVIHLYMKNQIPIIGTGMIKSRYAVIIITETKKYCCFLSEKVYEMKNFKINSSALPHLYLEESGTRKFTENELIINPSEYMKPFNLSKDSDFIISSILIDFVSFPEMGDSSRVHNSYNDKNFSEFYKYSINKWECVRKDLIINFKIKAYEYDNYNQATEFINTNTIEDDPKLEMMLKFLWKVEQGIETFSLRTLEQKNKKHDKKDEQMWCDDIQMKINMK